VIKKYEGFRAKAYKDLGWSWYSIWFGSRSYPGEMISKKEADRRLSSTVQSLYQTVSTDFKLKPEQYAWLISFAYNCHNWYKAVAKDGLQEHPQWCKKACTGNKCTVYPGLVKRRAEEAKLLFQ
jgi:GH24 family phage-related lysozyme (muramidase)